MQNKDAHLLVLVSPLLLLFLLPIIIIIIIINHDGDEWDAGMLVVLALTEVLLVLFIVL
jgi:hypothetical protein